jgi:sulfonate transport system permease protein
MTASAIAGWLRPRWISIATVAIFLIGWEIAGHATPESALSDAPLVPPWEFVFGRSLLGMSDYWHLEEWAPVPSVGGEQTYRGAVLALAYHSGVTWLRMMAGLILGAVVGVGWGLAFSWSPLLRRLASMPLHILRMFPLLAMIPLFQFWVGANTRGVILFVAYGVGIVYFAGTINAVANVPDRYVEYARTLGASRFRTYRSVVLPAIVPELSTSILLTLGLAWSAVIGAEYIGVDTGLGRILIYAEYFSHTGRMALVAVLLVVYAGVSFFVFRRISDRLLSWMPTSAGRATTPIAIAAE